MIREGKLTPKTMTVAAARIVEAHGLLAIVLKLCKRPGSLTSNEQDVLSNTLDNAQSALHDAQNAIRRERFPDLYHQAAIAALDDGPPPSAGQWFGSSRRKDGAT